MNEKQPEAKKAMEEIKTEAKPLENILSNVNTGYRALGSVEEMKRKLEETDAKREVIFKWIEDNFVKGIDYGIADDRSPKDVLLKPGAEKLIHAFDTHATWVADWDTWKMLGEPENVICYICRIVDNATGKIIGEGRGAEKVGNKGRDTNKAIKIGEKCGAVDAALYTFMLSEKFTQDQKEKTRVLIELKQSILEDIGKNRAGCESKLTDVNFLITVLKAELHKNKIETIGEAIHIRKVLFEQKLYNWGTGEKV